MFLEALNDIDAEKGADKIAAKEPHEKNRLRVWQQSDDLQKLTTKVAD